MKYQYKFGTGYESVEVDEEWMAVLREMDRLERNSNISESRKAIHYDAFGFEPDFMGVDEKGYADSIADLADIFDGSPAFEYAVDHLLPKHREVLYRRAVQEESFASIARSFNSSTSVVWSYYQRLVARFRKYYDEWHWLHSNENTAPEGAGKIIKLTRGLTPAQIMAIRAYRYQYKRVRDIVQLVGVPITRVEACLRDNPILETKCPACGTLVKQPPLGQMRVFCSHKCYLKWYRDNACNFEVFGPTTRTKAHLTEHQKMMINFYRQLYINVPQIGKIVGIPRMHVQAFVHEYPLPYTLCQFCGAKIPPRDSRKLLKFCNDKCRERHDNKMRTLRKRNGGHVRQRLLPTPEQIEYALILRDECFTFKQIRRIAGLSRQDTEELFRFCKTVVKTCQNCKKPFVTEDMQELYCSQKCQDKAKAKRKKKRKKEKKKNDTA